MFVRYPARSFGRGTPAGENTGGEPAWLSAHPTINEWFAISGTSGAGGADIDAYCGFALKPSTPEIIIAAAGGHPGMDNRVVSCDLSAGSPSWTTRKAATASPNDSAADNDSYNASDGTPMARHLYNYIQYISQTDRVMLVGGYAIGTVARYTVHVDGFNLATNAWDAAGTYTDMPVAGNYGNSQDASGVIYTGGGKKFNAVTNTWGTHPHSIGRFPTAYDSSDGSIFSLQWADGQGFGSGVTANRANLGAGTTSTISFNSSAALTQFIADAPTYSGMDYDSFNDNFLFYCGQGSGAGRIYKITKNGTTTWDISILSLGGGSSTPGASPAAGVNKRFQYVPAYKGFVMLPQSSSNLYFIRTA